MISQIPGPAAADFIWASGIEDTFVPQVRTGQRALDEYELLGHYEHWREDLELGKELGIQAIRWGVPWYRVEPQRGKFDWQWTDQVIPYLIHDLGITPIIDLMHYGCPFWLVQEFANPDYPHAVAAYAAAFAERYRGLIRWYTPLNEPLVNASMCGKLGRWPPYLRGDSGYLRVMIQLVKGIRKTIQAIKAVEPQALMVHVEATGLRRVAQAELEPLAVEDHARNYLPFDLLTGCVKGNHPLSTWLLRNGVHPNDLADFSTSSAHIDVMGLNFYPQWSTKEVSVDRRGKLRYRNVEKDGLGFAQLIRDFYERYRIPIMVTETSARGPILSRARWLEASVAAVKQLRSDGIPVLGYTWFPLFTMIKWNYRYGRRPLEAYFLELGFYSLNTTGAGPRWKTTALVNQWHRYVADPAAAIGSLKVDN